MKRLSVHPKSIKASTEATVQSRISNICRHLLDLVDDGIISEDEYEDIREILYRFEDR